MEKDDMNKMKRQGDTQGGNIENIYTMDKLWLSRLYKELLKATKWSLNNIIQEIIENGQ